MADISPYIEAFESAVYGADVRSAMVNLANAVNDEVESDTSNVSSYTSSITTQMATLSSMQTTVTNAQTTCNTINAQAIEDVAKAVASATSAATSATLAESYAVGDTNARTDESTDNAKYYYNSAKIAQTECESLLEQTQTLVDTAQAKVAGWSFWIDVSNGGLYVDTDSTGVTFGVDASDGYLFMEVV